MLHKHRLLPGYAGGTYESDNVLLCSIEEHANIHKTMWLFHQDRRDYLAWKFLTGQISKGEISAELKLLRYCRQVATMRTSEYRSSHIMAMNKPETRMRNRLSHLGRKHSVETRRRMSATKKGCIFSPEHCTKISIAKSHCSLQTRQRLSKALTGKIPTETSRNKNREWHLGKTHSNEIRKKIKQGTFIGRLKCTIIKEILTTLESLNV